MEKTFVEDLWEKFPEQTENAIKKICNLNEKWGDRLEFERIKNGALTFKKYGRALDFIVVKDFSIRTSSYSSNDYETSTTNTAWIKFMYSIYGNKYALQYIDRRNQQLDKFMAEYEEQYNEETRTVLDDIGFQANKGQTK